MDLDRAPSMASPPLLFLLFLLPVATWVEATAFDFDHIYRCPPFASSRFSGRAGGGRTGSTARQPYVTVTGFAGEAANTSQSRSEKERDSRVMRKSRELLMLYCSKRKHAKGVDDC
ncbi:hypothetical protein B296_00059022 [Ensete ventricosum]|uniref:Secreted protein n=1 Tax=Ensete ventricosum TaxID=4639 RepID=A0A426XJG7_ENSVE|nr:hypothetical protein B296_00059022 [Ensete ventricosum]